MSSGYSCNLGYPIPENWAFDQFYELKGNEQFNSTPSFDLDKVGYSGRDTGISNFDEVPYLTPDQLAESNSENMVEIQRDQFVYNVLEPLGYLDVVSNASLTYNQEFLLDTISLNGLTVRVTAEVSDTLATNFDGNPITIDVDNTGKLTASCEAEIEGLISGIELGDFEGIDIINSTIDDLKEVAVSITSGKIGVKVDLTSAFPKLTFIITSEDILPDLDEIDEEITVEISFELIPTYEPEYNFEINVEALLAYGLTLSVIIGLLALSFTPGGQALVLQYLVAIGALSQTALGGA